MMVRIAILLVAILPFTAVAKPDPGEGRKLVETHKCETCHQQRDGSATGTIYLRSDRKVTSWAKLKAQVAFCNTMLKTSLFPDEEEHIAAFLNQTYYKLPVK